MDRDEELKAQLDQTWERWVEINRKLKQLTEEANTARIYEIGTVNELLSERKNISEHYYELRQKSNEAGIHYDPMADHITSGKRWD